MCIKLELSMPRQQIQRRHLLFASQIRRRTRYTRLACCFDFVCLFVCLLVCLFACLLAWFRDLFWVFKFWNYYLTLSFVFPIFLLSSYLLLSILLALCFIIISYLFLICLYFVLFCFSGCLIAKKKVFRNPVPGGCGGGTVVFVSNKDHVMSRYVTSCYVVWCHVMSYYVMFLFF